MYWRFWRYGFKSKTVQLWTISVSLPTVKMRIVAGNSEAGLRTKGVNYEHYIDKHLLTRLNLFLLTICISLCKKLLFCVPIDISHLPDWKSTNLWNSFRVIVDRVSQLSVVVEDEPPSLPTFRGPSNLIGERLFKNIFLSFKTDLQARLEYKYDAVPGYLKCLVQNNIRDSDS